VAVPGHPRTGACSPPHPGIWIVAPLPPQSVHRAERRNMSLEASAPHRMIHGVRAVGVRRRQRAQITHSQGVTPRRSARVATGMLGVRLITAACRHSPNPESHEGWLPAATHAARSCFLIS
jgi:hypothetical protein